MTHFYQTEIATALLTGIASGMGAVRTHETVGSWVIRRREDGAVQFETFSPSLVAALNTAKYEAVPILAYLQGVNRAIR